MKFPDRLGFTLMEARFAELLATAPHAVTFEDMMRHLYGPGLRPSRRTLSVYACHVRRKLRLEGIEILTLHGIGWTITPVNRRLLKQLGRKYRTDWSDGSPNAQEKTNGASPTGNEDL